MFMRKDHLLNTDFLTDINSMVEQLMEIVTAKSHGPQFKAINHHKATNLQASTT